MSIDYYIRNKVLPYLKKKLSKKNQILNMDASDSRIAGNSVILLAIKGEIYFIANDLCILKRSDGFDAIGSGKEYALGSLFSTKDQDFEAGKKVLTALKAAVRYNNGCAAPFRVYHTKKNGVPSGYRSRSSALKGRRLSQLSQGTWWGRRDSNPLRF